MYVWVGVGLYWIDHRNGFPWERPGSRCIATEGVRSTTDMELVKTLISWILKLVRYVILHVFIPKCLDNYLFIPIEAAIIQMLGEEEEEEYGVGGGGVAGRGVGGSRGAGAGGAGGGVA